jgi:lantibiotic modifying enzyme
LGAHRSIPWPGLRDPGEPLPFEDLFIPLTGKARQRVIQRVGHVTDSLLLSRTLDGWERYLLKRLVWVSAQALNWQFAVHKTVAQAFTSKPAGRDPNAQRHYVSFVEEPSKRLQLLLEEFPELVKMHELLISDWISGAEDFAKRLSQDQEELADRFKKRNGHCSIRGVQVGLSDPHLGGRTVANLAYEEEPGPFYKPRSVAVEDHFSAIVQLMNSSGIPHPLRAARCWNRGEYGWMENISHKPCGNLSGVGRFYWRAGALMGLVYLAKGVDIHRQNMIADGEFPILVDLETLWHPQDHVGDAGAVSIAPSVMRTGFLPTNNRDAYAPYEWSALSRRCAQTEACWTWINVNTDQMQWVFTIRASKDLKHLPSLDGVLFPANDFVDQVQAGFRWVCAWFLTGNNQRNSFREWIAQLATLPLRQIRRSSAYYLPYLEHLRSPHTLRGAGNSECFPDSLKVPEESPAETRALRQLDIPYIKQDIGPYSADFYRLSRQDILQHEEIIAAAFAMNSHCQENFCK